MSQATKSIQAVAVRWSETNSDEGLGDKWYTVHVEIWGTVLYIATNYSPLSYISKLQQYGRFIWAVTEWTYEYSICVYLAALHVGRSHMGY